MKATTLFLAASLAANAALVAVYVTRAPATAPTSAAAVKTQPAARVSGNASDATLRAALESGNAAALEAAGLSPDVARDLALGRAFSRIAEKIRAAKATQTADTRWWRQRDAGQGSREQQLQLRREISDAMFTAFGEDLSSMSSGQNALAFLSPEKRDALRRITQDYDEMMAKFSTGGIQLASDREKLRLLRAERDNDIAALLTPEERLAYELRTSPTALAVRARFGEGIETEEDFRKIYALQKGFDEKFSVDAGGRMTPETMRQRTDAQRQLQDDIRAALGEDKFATLRRATDADLRNVESLVSRLNLPPATTHQVATARETFAAESQRINANTSLDAQQRRAQIQELANRAKSELTRTLGSEAGDAYAQRSPWVSMLQGGMAYSTTPPPNSPVPLAVGGQSVFPVLPAGVTPGAPGATRQVVMTGGTVDVVGGGGGDLFFAPAAGTTVIRDNVQVMTFSPGATGDPAATGGNAPVQRRMQTPAQPAPPPKQ